MPALVTDKPMNRNAASDKRQSEAIKLEQEHIDIENVEASVATTSSCSHESDASMLNQISQPADNADILASLCPLPKRKLSTSKRKKSLKQMQKSPHVCIVRYS